MKKIADREGGKPHFTVSPDKVDKSLWVALN